METLHFILITSIIISVILLTIRSKTKTDFQISWNYRGKMMDLAIEDYHKGIISRKQLMFFLRVCHPSFRDFMDYIPMSEADSYRKIIKTDKEFWRAMRIKPSSLPDLRYVYDSYKSFMSDKWDRVEK